MYNVASIIPARSGSKSLPNKNIQILDDKPLVCHSISYSLECDLVSKTVVSTDCTDIAAIASEWGAEVPFIRPMEYAQDDTTDYYFMRHALDFFENRGMVFDIYILLRPTSPLRPNFLIEKALNVFETFQGVSSVRSVTQIKEHPYRSWVQLDDGSIRGFVEDVFEPYNIPRQSLPKVYFQTGDIEAVSRETLLSGSVSGTKVFPLVLNHNEMVDIDDNIDFAEANRRIQDRYVG